MSNNHQPYRGHPVPAPTEHTHPSYSSSDHNQHFYRQPLELPSPFPPQSSSSYAPPLLPGSDSALNILKSCGLEPTDLSLLAELPEDALTLDSLPHLLKQIKVRRLGGQTLATPPAPPLSSSSSSHPPRSSSRQMTSMTSSATSGEWDKLRTQPIQYPLDHVLPTAAKSRPLPREQVHEWQDRWGNPRQIGSITHQKTTSSSASSSGYGVDYAHKDRPAVGLYGRVGPSAAASGESTKKPPSLFSLNVEPYRPKTPYSRVPPPAALSSQPGVVDYRKAAKEYMSLQPQQVSPYVGQPNLSQKQPSRKVALDFHGTPPVTYPYTCSLCEITVLSEKYWNSHVNSTRHADGQLTVLQQFPAWDCRLDNTRSSVDNEQSQRSKKHEEKAAQRIHPNKKTQPKPRPATGKVISAKFADQSVDETYLRSRVEPFGKVVKIILFPTLAFVEMGTSDQAKDLVKFYASNPVSAGGQNIIFDHSSTFNFLQSSRVVSFSPGPSGEDNISDLISIIKRFGPPLYTLLLPSVASVEMKFALDAQKLVDYYSTNILKIDDVAIKVFFSGEYNTLMRVPKAKKYEEKESSVRKRSRTRSPHSVGRTRSRSPSPKRSRDKEDGGKRTDRETVSSGRKTEVDKERNREAEKKRDGEKASNITETLQSETAADKPALSGPSQPETNQMDTDGHQEDQVSEEDSDIEGMAVLGEDVDFVDDSDDEREEGAEDGEGQTAEKEEVPEQSTGTSTEPVEVSAAQSDQQEVSETVPPEAQSDQQEVSETVPSEAQIDQQEVPETVPEEDMESESDADFPTDLSSCITLDELGEETEEEAEKCGEKKEEHCTKVLCLKNLPFSFTDEELLSIVKDYGKVYRYHIRRRAKVGFIEMDTVFDAVRAVAVLSSKTLWFKGSVILVQLCDRYKTINTGYDDDEDVNRTREETEPVLSLHQALREKKRKQRQHKKNKKNKMTKQRKWEEEQEAIAKEEKIREKEEENREKGESEEEIKKTGEEIKETEQEQEENRMETGEEEKTKETGEEENREIKEMGEEEKTKETGEEENREIKETGEEENREIKDIGEEEKTKETGEEEKREIKETGEEEKTKETGEEEKTKETGEENREETKETEQEEKRMGTGVEKKTNVTDGRKRVGERRSQRLRTGRRSETGEEEKTKETGEEEKTKETGEEEKTKETGEEEKTKETGEEEKTKESGEEETTGGEMETQEDHIMDTGETMQEEQPATSEEVASSEPGSECPMANNKENPEAEVKCLAAAAEPIQPTKPVGTEFVRPVVGYFCNLCQVIYADEEEAKRKHCSTLQHYNKYQEHTGRDPWTS